MNTKLWECPDCGRKFSKLHQEHTCSTHTIDNHFAEKSPVVRILFDIFIEKVKSFGNVRINPVKTSITFVSRFTFAVVQIQQSAIKLEFVTPYEINDKRIIKKVQANKNDFVHFVKITSPEDFDKRLIKWLKDSYKHKLAE